MTDVRFRLAHHCGEGLRAAQLTLPVSVSVSVSLYMPPRYEYLLSESQSLPHTLLGVPLASH